ncbi:hypothetical protein N7468_009660 [Penicillium chermesinum]|uniref:Uncharacterized protein n=1 Tax=Penicillium chermesinum TaxID=63820 RepID=A0A9W9NI63_9EURO|nr:uncharacterized protein N7468_009660 [Penicillium chermesinum]KAJ5220456.1 hypothetical protein N7468_009660 [Penicillium chermesinum]
MRVTLISPPAPGGKTCYKYKAMGKSPSSMVLSMGDASVVIHIGPTGRSNSLAFKLASWLASKAGNANDSILCHCSLVCQALNRASPSWSPRSAKRTL